MKNDLICINNEYTKKLCLTLQIKYKIYNFLENLVV